MSDRVMAVLRQGLTPPRLASSLLLGFACGCMPVLGTSTLLSAGIALLLRLNQAAIQLGNFAAAPLQLLLFLPYLRLGEWVFGDEPLPFSPTQLLEMVQADPWGFVHELWTTVWHALVAWLLTVPPFFAAGYLLLLPVLRWFLRRHGERLGLVR